jgi:hypothetical protein
MEPSGYVFTFCLLSAVFLWLTLQIIVFYVVIHSGKNWGKEARGNVGCSSTIVLFFAAYLLTIVFQENLGIAISNIPFWIQLLIIGVLGLIDFTGLVITMVMGGHILDSWTSSSSDNHIYISDPNHTDTYNVDRSQNGRF